MIMASILVGIAAGSASFLFGLASGQGFASALGLYVAGGTVGMGSAIALIMARQTIRSHQPTDRSGLSTVRG